MLFLFEFCQDTFYGIQMRVIRWESQTSMTILFMNYFVDFKQFHFPSLPHQSQEFCLQTVVIKLDILLSQQYLYFLFATVCCWELILWCCKIVVCKSATTKQEGQSNDGSKLSVLQPFQKKLTIHYCYKHNTTVSNKVGVRLRVLPR